VELVICDCAEHLSVQERGDAARKHSGTPHLGTQNGSSGRRGRNEPCELHLCGVHLLRRNIDETLGKLLLAVIFSIAASSSMLLVQNSAPNAVPAPTSDPNWCDH
jgi:hypothetical protein